MNEQIRQGDVYLIRVSDSTEAPTGAEIIAKDHGRVVLAYGEVTGHAHAITEEWATLFQRDDERLVVLPHEATLRHEEHTAHRLAPGTWRVVIQSEYVPNALPRNVAD